MGLNKMISQQDPDGFGEATFKFSQKKVNHFFRQTSAVIKPSDLKRQDTLETRQFYGFQTILHDLEKIRKPPKVNI